MIRECMTFGVLPARVTFEEAFDAECEDGTYAITLNGSDSAGASRCGLDGDDGVPALAGVHSPASLWTVVKALTFEWDHHGDDWAGLWASDILGTLGFEWI
jgi:hypothetical protein